MKKSRICWIRILFPVLSVLLFSIFLLTIKVNAADGESTAYFPMGQNDNGIFTDSLLTAIDTQFNSSDNYVIVRYNNHNTGTGRYNFFYIRFPKTNLGTFYGEVNTNGYQFSLYKAGSGTFYQGSFYVTNLNNPTIQGLSTSTNGALGNWSNIYSSKYDTTKSYVSNFKIWSSNSENRYVILNYGSGDTITNGFATRPDKQERMDFLHNNRPDHVPDPPTVNNYSWTTYNPPSIDTSTIENILESLLNRTDYNFSYLFSNIAGLFSNLISNIGSYFEYLGELIAYGFDVVVNNIIAGIENFYDNMVSLIEPLVATVDNIGSFVAAFYALGLDSSGNFVVGQMFTSLFVPSSQQVIQVVLDHDDFDFIGTSKVVIEDAPRILSSLYNVTPTPVFHVPSCTYHGVEIGDYDISFAWYAPYKVYVDTIISALLIIGYVYWIFISLSSHIRTTYQPAPESK